MTALSLACAGPIKVGPAHDMRIQPVAVQRRDAPTRLEARAVSDEIFARTNLARRAAGLPRLARNESLMSAAQLQADQMAATRTMAHQVPRTAYPTLNSRLALVS